MVREVAWALSYAHAQGVVHRDVKPDNILLEKGTERALVADFGIAQVGMDPVLPESGHVVGTAEFMSPEQATGASVDGRSDLYSLGLVGYYAVSGRVPFEDASAEIVLAKHVSEPPAPLASVAPHVSTLFARVIDRCLRKSPAERFADGGAVADALAQELAIDRTTPVPLRVFIRKLREMAQSVGSGVAFVLIFLTPGLAAAVFRGSLFAVLGVLSVTGVITGIIAGMLSLQARKVLKAGFTPEEARLALQQDVLERNEEFRFDVGARETPVDKLLKGAGILGLFGGFAAMGVGAALGGPESLLVGGALAIGGGVLSGLVQSVRARRRADLVGERWLRLWSGKVGDLLFKIGALGVRPTDSPAIAGHRPTEMVIGIAAGRLYETLPKEARAGLPGLPETVRKLEEDARALRGQVAELDHVLVEIGDQAPSEEAEERERVRTSVQETRDQAEARLRSAVAALETIRIGLLRMHAGESVLQSVTMELKAAKSLSEDMVNLLEGHREVERLLAERRATGTFRILGDQ
jgi:hypothetical protein